MCAYLICDGLCNGVPVRRWLVPVRLANKQDHAGRDADEETERGAKTERRHLKHGVVLHRHDQMHASRSMKSDHAHASISNTSAKSNNILSTTAGLDLSGGLAGLDTSRTHGGLHKVTLSLFAMYSLGIADSML